MRTRIGWVASLGWMCWLCLAGQAVSQAPAEDLLTQARGLAREGRHAEAIPIYEELMSEVEGRDNGDSEPLVYLLHELAVQHHALGDATAAETLYRRSLRLAEKHHGEHAATLAPILRGLAAVAAMRGRLDDAEAHHRRVLKIQETEASGGAEMARTLAELGVLRQLQGQSADAEGFYQRALASADENDLSPTEIVTISGNLGAIYARQERYAEAEQSYLKVLAIRERELGPQHPDLVKVLLELASLQFRQRRYSRAAASYERGLRLRERTQSDDLAQSDILSQLAATYRQLGRTAEAEAHFAMAKTILGAQCQGRERTTACRDAAMIHQGLVSRPRDSTNGLIRPNEPLADEDTARAPEVAGSRSRAAASDPASPAKPPSPPRTRVTHRVQVAARQVREQAVALLAGLQADYPDLLGDLDARVFEVDLGDRGVWHRVQIGAFTSRARAKALCGELVRRGHDDCWVAATEEP